MQSCKRYFCHLYFIFVYAHISSDIPTCVKKYRLTAILNKGAACSSPPGGKSQIILYKMVQARRQALFPLRM